MNEDSEKTAAIVLGGGLKRVQVGDQTRYEPEAQAKARLDMAYALFVEGKVDVIISTGKYGVMAKIDPKVAGPQTEAAVGGAYLIAKAKASGDADLARKIEACLVYEDQSIDTIGNAWYAKKLCLEPLGITSCIIVTSDYHVARSKVIFEWILGPGYTVTCAAAPSPLSGRDRERRDRFEQMLTDLLRTRLMPGIPAGDDEAIAKFIETEHRALLRGGGPPPPGLLPDGVVPPAGP
ncbi:MAG: YdcF family protein [Anaerolineae bacterium]|nr:YdcF family protein [Anaerolineae bacterium]